uniref:Uncharacterized protein n=1 Tax=Anopheles funestus TaxID=62324 RepID=A0A4Y0BHU1_ANOFN
MKLLAIIMLVVSLATVAFAQTARTTCQPVTRKARTTTAAPP